MSGKRVELPIMLLFVSELVKERGIEVDQGGHKYHTMYILRDVYVLLEHAHCTIFSEITFMSHVQGSGRVHVLLHFFL